MFSVQIPIKSVQLDLVAQTIESNVINQLDFSILATNHSINQSYWMQHFNLHVNLFWQVSVWSKYFPRLRVNWLQEKACRDRA